MYETLACRSPCLAVFGDFDMEFIGSYTEREWEVMKRERGVNGEERFLGFFLNKEYYHVIKNMPTHFFIRHIRTKLTVVNRETNCV